jgi:hypothetical protein
MIMYVMMMLILSFIPINSGLHSGTGLTGTPAHRNDDSKSTLSSNTSLAATAAPSSSSSA